MSQQDTIRIGPVFWFSGLVLMPMLTAGSVWVGAISWEVLAPAFFLFGIMGLLVVLVAIMAAQTKGRAILFAPFGIREAVASLLGFGLLAGFNLFVFYLFDIPLSSGVGTADNLLTGILFAIMEENLMFGAYLAGKMAGAPDIAIIIISTIVFIPLHALVQVLNFAFIVFLVIGRSVFTGLYATTDHSDPSYVVHIAWNVVMSI